jgi:putative FmdB family regulatory protein
MPIYEYECRACGHHLDSLQKINEAPLTDCPACQKPALTKMISASSFQLKGTGWYETDFKTKPKTDATSSNSSSSTDKSSKSS